MIIAVDFDGTIVDHRYPDIGDECAGAIRWLRKFQEMGALLILHTMRSDGCSDGTAPLTEAVEWCRERGLEFHAHNVNPDQASWTQSPKVYAHVYIDDAALGCPLREGPRMGGRKQVDWSIVGPKIEAMLSARADAGKG